MAYFQTLLLHSSPSSPTPITLTITSLTSCSYISLGNLSYQSIMLTKQPTLDSFVASGYETDNSTAPPRRSCRTVTPARRPAGMITPSSDSRRSLDLKGGVRDVRDAHVHRRRERSASLPGDEFPREQIRCRSKTVSRPLATVSNALILISSHFTFLTTFNILFFLIRHLVVVAANHRPHYQAMM